MLFVKTYKNKGLDSKDPYAALKQDIVAYSQQGEVLLVGDFNARTTNNQASILCCKEDNNPIWLTEEENPQWVRCSKDDKVSNHFGEELLTLCGAFNLIICNRLDRWKRSGNFTCNTYNGASVVDYVMCSQSLIEKIDEVSIGEHIWDLKSDHNPIFIRL